MFGFRKKEEKTMNAARLTLQIGNLHKVVDIKFGAMNDLKQIAAAQIDGMVDELHVAANEALATRRSVLDHDIAVLQAERARLG